MPEGGEIMDIVVGRGKLGQAIGRVNPDCQVISHREAASIYYGGISRLFICCANTHTRGTYNEYYAFELWLAGWAQTHAADDALMIYTFGSNYEGGPTQNAYVDSKRALRFLHRCRHHHRWIHTTLSNLYVREDVYLERYPEKCVVPRGTNIEPLQVDAVAAKLLTLTEPGEYHLRGKPRPLGGYLTEHGRQVIEVNEAVEFPIDWADLERGILGKQVKV